MLSYYQDEAVWIIKYALKYVGSTTITNKIFSKTKIITLSIVKLICLGL